MKKNLSVLVLLMMLALWAVPSLISPATAAEVQDRLEDRGEGPSGNLTWDTDGDPADDSRDGDPGDAGDGYGANSGPKLSLDGTGCEGADGSGWDEYLIILLSWIQLAL